MYTLGLSTVLYKYLEAVLNAGVIYLLALPTVLRTKIFRKIYVRLRYLC